jgi:hypothetical protein
MKTLAYIPLFYGKEYLEYVLKSLEGNVDDILILYTDHPSYGHGSELSNPETKEELKAITDKFNCIWQDIPQNLTGEGRHRDLAEKHASNYDVLMAVDSDEVWKPETIEPCIKAAYDGKERRYRTNHQGWYHFWRSFNEVFRDGFEPERFINMRRHTPDKGRVLEPVIYHFGYANSIRLQEYKMSIHGHKSEVSNQWFTDKWLNYKRDETKNMHPSSRDVWKETEPFNKETLPDHMKDHPYFNLDRIE